LHERVAMYFEKRLEKVTGEEAERLGLERLYHRVRADEEMGIKLFQEMAERFASTRLISNLHTLLNDINIYPLMIENHILWRQYYTARLAQLASSLYDAESIYRLIESNKRAESKLRAYTLYSLGTILSKWQRLGESGAVEKAKIILQESLALVPIDAYLVGAVSRLAHVYRYEGNWDKAATYNNNVVDFFLKDGNKYGLLDAYQTVKMHFAGIGEWGKMLDAHASGLQTLAELPTQSPHLRSYFLMASSWAWSFIGRCAEVEENLKKVLITAKQTEDSYSLYWANMQIGLTLAFQNRFDEAEQHFVNGLETLQTLGMGYETHIAYIQGFRGLCYIKQNRLSEAKEKLTQSLSIRETYNLNPDIPEVYVWLGQLHEIMRQADLSSIWYERCMSLKWTGRRNFISESLTGLIRVKHAQGDIAAIPSLLAEAEQLAQQYEYNDHLASLRLTQGHLAFEGWGDVASPAQQNKGTSSLEQYQKAMIYALRYNRFLLDELLSGRPQGTPLRPIIPHCLERGEEGKKILFALRNWWKTGVNDIGTPRPDTISPIPEGIPLLEAEKIAREREPGDGSIQKSVIEQLEAVL